ncbi:MAG: gluconate 2-dehydrogenase subunit 3 family protein [Alphaproteobacteria bacterium]|nr:MAG: gluconate 2-dehydrogenase subunit 3 family protein [Alphaproteobacteria bacterium]
MKRRHVVALLGYFSLGGAAARWRPLRAFGRPDPREHIARAMTAVVDVMFEALIATGVTWLDQRATLQGASDFLALDEAQRLAALDAAFASPDQGIQPFVLALRYHVGTAYYSAPAIKSAFAYTGPPQPDGFADFQERPA